MLNCEGDRMMRVCVFARFFYECLKLENYSYNERLFFDFIQCV